MKFITRLRNQLATEYAPATVGAYLPKIRQYVAWLVRHRNVSNEAALCATAAADVDAWLDTRPPASASSRNLAINALSAMYRLIGCDDVQLAHLRALNKRSGYPTEPVTEAEAQQIIMSVRPPYNAILLLLYYHGLSVQQALRLRPGDIDALALDALAKNALTGWLRQRELSPGDLLFPNRRANLAHVVTGAVNRLGLTGKNITPTSFRIGGAVRLWQNGATDAEVRDWLGVSASTLYRYKRHYSGD